MGGAAPPVVAPSSPLGRRDAILAAAVFLLALTLRLGFVAEIRDEPLSRYLISDARAYVEWAEEIAAGDWLGRARGVFYQAPLYPYGLAVVSRLGGALPEAARWWGAVFGALGCGLLFLAGRLLRDRVAGLSAGALLALYPPAIFFEGMIGKEGGAIALTAALLAALAWVARRPAVSARWLLPGAILGVLALLREDALLAVAAVLAWTVWDSRRNWRFGLRKAGIFVAGLLLVLLPVGLRNAVVGGTFALTTSQAGPNFYIGNRAGASGSYTPLVEGRSDTPFEAADARRLAERASGRKLTAGEVSRYWLGRAWEDITAAPAAWLALLAKKAWMTVHAYEVPDARDLYLERESSRLLAALVPVLHLGILGPLALFGAIAARGVTSRGLFLSVAVSFLAAPVLFYVFARYRVPIVPLAALLAGLGVSSVVAEGAARWKRPRWLVAAGAALLLAVVANLPAPWRGDRAMLYLNRGVALAGLGELEAATVEYRRALSRRPDLVEGNVNLGSTLLALGRVEEGLTHLERALERAPEDPEIALQVATGLVIHPDPGLRDPLRAVSLAEQALARERSSAGFRVLAAAYELAGLPVAAARAGRMARAEAQREQGVQ